MCYRCARWKSHYKRACESGAKDRAGPPPQGTSSESPLWQSHRSGQRAVSRESAPRGDSFALRAIAEEFIGSPRRFAHHS